MTGIRISTFAFPGYQRTVSVGWYVFDGANLVIADDAGNPSTCVINGALSATRTAMNHMRQNDRNARVTNKELRVFDPQDVSQVWVVDYNGIPCRFDPDADRLIDNEVTDSDIERTQTPEMVASLTALRAHGWRLEDERERMDLQRGRIGYPATIYGGSGCVRYVHNYSQLLMANEPEPEGIEYVSVANYTKQAVKRIQELTGIEFEQTWIVEDELVPWRWFAAPTFAEERFEIGSRLDPFLDAAIIDLLHHDWRPRIWPGPLDE